LIVSGWLMKWGSASEIGRSQSDNRPDRFPGLNAGFRDKKTFAPIFCPRYVPDISTLKLASGIIKISTLLEPVAIRQVMVQQ
jgi:hypothetical protein